MNSSTEANVADKRAILFVTTLAAFLAPFGISSVNIALPSLGREFQMDTILLSWVTTAYLLASAIFLVPFGKIADIYGRRKIFTSGIAIFTVASLGSGVSSSVFMLICFRVLQGIGAAAIYCIGAAILTSIFAPSELGKVLGINVAAVYLGYSVGPFLGGFLTHQLGWRSIFFANVVIGTIIISISLRKLRGEWREAGEDRFDLAGSLIYGFALLLVMYGFPRLSTVRGAFTVLIGILGILLFARWEVRTKSPVLDIGLFRGNRAFVLSNLATLINYGATFAVAFLLSLYLQYFKGLTPENAGLVLLSQPVMQTVFSPISGKLSDRIDARLVASGGMGLTALGLFLFVFLNRDTSLWFIVASLVLLGLGFALFSSPNTKAVMGSVESRYYGVVSGTLGTMRMAGMVFSMGITMLLFSIYIGNAQITPESYPLFLKCMRWTFIISATLCTGGIAASLARGPAR